MINKGGKRICKDPKFRHEKLILKFITPKRRLVGDADES